LKNVTETLRIEKRKDYLHQSSRQRDSSNCGSSSPGRAGARGILAGAAPPPAFSAVVSFFTAVMFGGGAAAVSFRFVMLIK
jgi:hypothetical protein